jgi:hypothetical protein
MILFGSQPERGGQDCDNRDEQKKMAQFHYI